MRRFWIITLVALVAGGVASGQEVTVQKEGWSATYSKPVHRYGHNIMGEIPEWSRLCMTGKGMSSCVDLPASRIFEDMMPRLADMDQDGAPEAVVIETGLNSGASLAIYKISERGLKQVTATPPIGRAFRWLAPVGVADFNGDGEMDVAYVEKPHLSKKLKVWSLRDGALRQIAQARELTNHRIGDETIAGGVRHCGRVPEMITLNGDWSRIISTSFEDGELVFKDLGANHGPNSLEQALGC